MGQVLLPDSISTPQVVSTTQVKLPASRVTVGGQQYTTTGDLFCSISTTGVGGLDTGTVQANTLYHLYAVRSGSTIALVLSLSSLAPSGFLSWNLINRFMTNGSSQVSYLVGTVNDGTPAGVILPFGGPLANIPDGYLGCDGTTRNRVAFAALFARIGTSWGAGDGSTTFHLPTTQGIVLRGRAAGASADPDRASRTASQSGGNAGDAVGSYQGDVHGSHAHTANNTTTVAQNTNAMNSNAVHTHNTNISNAANGTGSGDSVMRAGLTLSNYNYLIYGTNIDHTHTVPALTVNAPGINATGGNETRMKNAYVEYIVKF